MKMKKAYWIKMTERGETTPTAYRCTTAAATYNRRKSERGFFSTAKEAIEEAVILWENHLTERERKRNIVSVFRFESESANTLLEAWNEAMEEGCWDEILKFE